MRNYLSCFFICCLLGWNLAWAESVDAEADVLQVQVPKSTDKLRLKEEVVADSSQAQAGSSEIFMGLMAILGLIVLLAWFAKRLNLSGMSMGQALKVHSMMSLGTKEKLVVVEVEGVKLLLGVTPHNISVLKELEIGDQDPGDFKKNQVLSSDTNSFAQQIKKAIAQGKFSEKSKSD